VLSTVVTEGQRYGPCRLSDNNNNNNTTSEVQRLVFAMYSCCSNFKGITPRTQFSTCTHFCYSESFVIADSWALLFLLAWSRWVDCNHLHCESKNKCHFTFVHSYGNSLL